MTSLDPTPILADLIFPKELSSRIGLSVQTLARWRSEGQGPGYIKIGGRRVAYPAKAVERWLEGFKLEPAEKDDDWE